MSQNLTTLDAADRDALLAGRHDDPHRVLGARAMPDGVFVRVLQPDAADCLIVRHGVATAMQAEGDGFFTVLIQGATLPMHYTFRFIAPDGHAWERGDPYRHLPSIGDLDLYLFREGTHFIPMWSSPDLEIDKDVKPTFNDTTSKAKTSPSNSTSPLSTRRS